jgi:hypothetical protein
MAPWKKIKPSIYMYQQSETTKVENLNCIMQSYSIPRHSEGEEEGEYEEG